MQDSVAGAGAPPGVIALAPGRERFRVVAEHFELKVGGNAFAGNDQPAIHIQPRFSFSIEAFGSEDWIGIEGAAVVGTSLGDRHGPPRCSVSAQKHEPISR